MPEKLDPRPWKELVRIGGHQRSVEPGVETKARGDGDLGNRPEWFKGQTAGRQGKPLSANPYSGSAAKAWASGHKRGKEAMGDSRIEAVFAAADALFSRADAMETGRWDGVSAREEGEREVVRDKPKEEPKYKAAYK